METLTKAVLIQGVLISCQITKAHYKLEVVEHSVIKEGYQRKALLSW